MTAEMKVVKTGKKLRTEQAGVFGPAGTRSGGFTGGDADWRLMSHI